MKRIIGANVALCGVSPENPLEVVESIPVSMMLPAFLECFGKNKLSFDLVAPVTRQIVDAAKGIAKRLGNEKNFLFLPESSRQENVSGTTVLISDLLREPEIYVTSKLVSRKGLNVAGVVCLFNQEKKEKVYSLPVYSIITHEDIRLPVNKGYEEIRYY